MAGHLQDFLWLYFFQSDFQISRFPKNEKKVNIKYYKKPYKFSKAYKAPFDKTSVSELQNFATFYMALVSLPLSKS